MISSEEFYGEFLTEMKQAERRIVESVQTYAGTFIGKDDMKPVVYVTSRIKSPESVLGKCRIQNLDENINTAMDHFFDLIGIRIICAFSADVYHLARWVKEQDFLVIHEEKDYYARPKPNGYRSYHILLHVLPTGTPAEIQIRTIATDFWATLEHQIKYKKDVREEKMIREELKRCADEIASVDLSMQTIRDVLYKL